MENPGPVCSVEVVLELNVGKEAGGNPVRLVSQRRFQLNVSLFCLLFQPRAAGSSGGQRLYIYIHLLLAYTTTSDTPNSSHPVQNSIQPADRDAHPPCVGS
jgi:hypothetical protein